VKLPRSQQRCENCNAFALNERERQKPALGWCRASLPHLIQAMQQGPAISAKGPSMIPVSLANIWPPVTADQWCRQWEPINE